MASAEFPSVTRGIGSGLEHDRVAGSQRRADLGEVDLMWEVPRRDGTNDSDSFPDDGAPGSDSHRGSDTEIGSPGIGFSGVGSEFQIADRALQLRHPGEHPRSSYLGHGDLAEFLDVLAHGITQLTDAPHPQLGIRRPVGAIERTAGGIDGTAHIRGIGVGRGPEHLFGCGVDVRVPAGGTGFERAVDEQFAGAIGCYRHPRRSLPSTPQSAVALPPLGHLSEILRRTLSTLPRRVQGPKPRQQR